jgi:hypothetical protein
MTATFIIPHQYPSLSSKLDPYKPVLQERSKQETQIYCQQGVEFEQYLTICQSIPAAFIIPHHYPLLLSSKLDPYKPVLQERSQQETKNYCKLKINEVIILIVWAHAIGGGVRPIFDYMPKHSTATFIVIPQYPFRTHTASRYYQKEVNKKQKAIVKL